MIIRLEPDESSILSQIAQYTTDPGFDSEQLESLLDGTSSDAREIASVLLGKDKDQPVRPDITETANYFRQWANKNRAYANSRMAAG
jgi:hypothetical protein